jgi:hypothetical protein
VAAVVVGVAKTKVAAEVAVVLAVVVQDCTQTLERQQLEPQTTAAVEAVGTSILEQNPVETVELDMRLSGM